MHAYVRHLETLVDDDGRRVARGVVGRAGGRRGAVVPPVLRARASSIATRARRSARPRVPAGIPKALDEDEVDRLLQAVTGDDPVGAARPRAARAALRHRHPHQRGGRPRPRRPRSRRRHAAGARQGLEGADRAHRSGRAGRRRRVPARRAARAAPRDVSADDEGRRCRGAQRARWAHLATVVLGDRAPGGRAGRARRAPVAARPAAFLRDPHARPRRRPAGRAGAARPRQHLDDAGVHEGVARAVASRLRRRASARTRPPNGAETSGGGPDRGRAPQGRIRP